MAVTNALARLLGRPAAHDRAQVEAKASAAGSLIAFEHLGEPVWSPRDYGAFAREGFMQNAVVYRSVRMIAECAASVPLLLYAGEHEIEGHPLADLVRRPNPLQSGTDLLESWFGHLLVAGNAYLEAVSTEGGVRELYCLRPDRMRVVPGPNGWPEAYEYRVGDRAMRFRQDAGEGRRPILHMSLFHPLNDHYGMSPIEAAATAIDLHNAASKWNKALLDNAARPSGALVYAGARGSLTGEQFERLKAELTEGFAGARNAGRPMLLEGGLDWKALSLSPKDMDFMEAKNGAAREIALALGVPPMLLGIPGDNTYANYAEASRTLWRQTVLPLVARTARALSEWLSAGFDGGLELRPDLDGIEALAGEREALWTRLDKATFLSVDEKRAAAGYGPTAGGGLGFRYSPDQPRVPAGQPGGGQWTDGSGAPGTIDTPEGVPEQDAHESSAEAGEKVPTWFRRLVQRLMRDMAQSREKTLDEVLKPDGIEPGYRRPGAGDDIRTVTREEFGELEKQLLDGAKEVPPAQSYEGRWFLRRDGSIIGIRESADYGRTIDVINPGTNSTLPNGYRIHWR